jgi:hypothetical protein|tara:strand:- start:66 stop:671 length:606 start_codon:yes stop_codon:yes gene_type:complete
MKATHVSDEVAADDNGISASANPSNNADLTIGGALHSGNTVTNAGGRIVEITSAGDDSGIDATVIGTDVNGDALSETIDLADSGAAVTTGFFETITKITMVGNSAGNIIAGTTTSAADVIEKGACRLKQCNIVSGGTAGVINFHNGITNGLPGTILFKARTIGTDNTNEMINLGDDGVLFDKGCYVTYTIGHIDMMNFFFN